MTTTPIDAFDSFVVAIDNSNADHTKALQAKVAGMLVTWMRNVPPSLLPDLVTQLERAERAQQSTTDPLAGVMAFFGSNTPTKGNPDTPSALGGGSPAPAAAPVADSTLSVEQQLLLDEFDGVAPHEIRAWVDYHHRAKMLTGDQAKGVPNAIEDMLDGKLVVDPLGRPKAEAEVKRLQTEITTLETAKADLENKVTRLEAELAALRAAGTSDAMLNSINMAITKIYQKTGVPVPALNPTDEAAIKNHLDKVLAQDVETVVNALKAQITANVAAAKTAKTALDQVAGVGLNKQVVGRDKVEVELTKIINPAAPTS